MTDILSTDPSRPRPVLASGSATRAAMLRAAGIGFDTAQPRVDEDALRAALEAEGTTPRDLADALAEAKALKVSQRLPEALVIGADQVLEYQGRALAKPPDLAAARARLMALRGGSHRLHTAVVVAEAGRPVWRHLDTARLTMRAASDALIDAYLARHGAGLCASVGAYRIEDEGVRLFSRIDGDQFAILGLPLVALLDYLSTRGVIAT
ncbi:MAG: Maf family protein [Rhodobacteraceae bacterium]|nr:Maf family protein [Paracoccaceae bacterium]